MNHLTINRREFVNRTAVATAAASLATVGYHVSGAESAKIKVGQIGTKHAHASGKMDTLRQFSDLYEVVGVVEPDAQRRQQLAESETYRDLKWMSEEELLNTSGLQAVAVETEVRQLLPVAERCVAAGMHIHLDKRLANRSVTSNGFWMMRRVSGESCRWATCSATTRRFQLAFRAGERRLVR